LAQLEGGTGKKFAIRVELNRRSSKNSSKDLMTGASVRGGFSALNTELKTVVSDKRIVVSHTIDYSSSKKTGSQIKLVRPSNPHDLSN